MTIITADDVRDELINPALENADFIELQEYLTDFVYQVAQITLDDIENVPFKLKELEIAYICKTVCLHKSYSASLSTRGSENKDAWSEKLVYYTNLLGNLEASITADLLTGNSSQSYVTYTIDRG